jgi:hypothetical protein
MLLIHKDVLIHVLQVHGWVESRVHPDWNGSAK